MGDFELIVETRGTACSLVQPDSELRAERDNDVKHHFVVRFMASVVTRDLAVWCFRVFGQVWLLLFETKDLDDWHNGDFFPELLCQCNG